MSNETKDLKVTDPELRDDATAARTLPVLPVRDTVLFPHAVLPLTVGRESSVQLINSLGEDKTIVVVAQREARVDSPQPTDLYAVGSLAVVHKVVRMPNQSLFVFAEGSGARQGDGVHAADSVHVRDGRDHSRDTSAQELRRSRRCSATY